MATSNGIIIGPTASSAINALQPKISAMWPSAHEAVQNGKILVAGCKGVVLHPVDSGDADIEMAGDLADAHAFIEHAHHL